MLKEMFYEFTIVTNSNELVHFSKPIFSYVVLTILTSPICPCPTAHTVLVPYTEFELQMQQVTYPQGSHRLEKYLNIESFLENSLKTKSAFNSTIFCRTTLLMDTSRDQYKNGVPLFEVAYADQKEALRFYINFQMLNGSLSRFSEV